MAELDSSMGLATVVAVHPGIYFLRFYQNLSSDSQNILLKIQTELTPPGNADLNEKLTQKGIQVLRVCFQ